jgi:hypothetical protein
MGVSLFCSLSFDDFRNINAKMYNKAVYNEDNSMISRN